MAKPPFENPSEIPNVPWSDVVRFIRQFSHVLRNHLNATELQSVYISELERDEELKIEIKRLREMVCGLTSVLQSLSRAVSEPEPGFISYGAADFVEHLRKKIEHDFFRESPQITWDIQLRNAVLNIDPQLLQEAFSELFANAFRHDRGKGVLVVTARMDGNEFLFMLEEPKSQFDLCTDNWGRKPLRQISQGHYGLGLNRVRAIVETHGGRIHAEYNPKTSVFTTTLALPSSGGPSKDA